MNLTAKQLTLARLIRDYRNTRGYSPTMQELADELGVSKVTVFEGVDALVRKGVLIREPGKARSLEVSPDVALPADLNEQLRAIVAHHGASAVRAGLDEIEKE